MSLFSCAHLLGKCLVPSCFLCPGSKKMFSPSSFPTITRPRSLLSSLQTYFQLNITSEKPDTFIHSNVLIIYLSSNSQKDFPILIWADNFKRQNSNSVIVGDNQHGERNRWTKDFSNRPAASPPDEKAKSSRSSKLSWATMLPCSGIIPSDDEMIFWY